METTLAPAPISTRLLQVTSFAFYPTGVIRIWKNHHQLWIRLVYTIVGLPVFLLVFVFLALTGFALFLPPLDMTIGNRPDRTVISTKGNYRATFLKTGNDTGGAYELVQVEVEPHGGNEWHYHTKFDEYFTVLKGQAKIGSKGQDLILNKGDKVTAYKGEMHYFSNPSNATLLLQVKTSPAQGMEKSIRIAYGLMNDGQFTGAITKNPWHMALLLAYSGTYLAGIPGIIQEPLVNALAKIAQWKGEDKPLEKYFR